MPYNNLCIDFILISKKNEYVFMVDRGKEYCEECGFEGIEFIGDVKNTRTFKCPDCFTEKLKFIDNTICEHEYPDRSLDKCIHCGKNK